MKRFFLFSVSCLILAVACLVFSYAFHSDANAQDGEPPYFMILGGAAQSVYVAVGDNGYEINFTQPGWLPLEPGSAPPVPLSSLVYFNYLCAVTDTGEGWVHRDNYTRWENIGPVPGVVSTQKETFGGVKTLYR